MGFTALISTCTTRMLPFLAILRYDLRTLLGSWLVRLWLGGAALLALLMLMSVWAQLPTALAIALLLFPFLVFPWFLVVMVLGIDPVSGSRIEALADGILSRPVTRHEYLLASWLARVLIVLGVFVVVVVPAVLIITLAERNVPEDNVTLYGIVAALGVVALVLTFQVTLAFLLGTLLRRPMLAIVVLVFVWYPVNVILHTFQLEEFSPLSLSQAMPKLLRTTWSETPEDRAQRDVGLEALAQQTAQFFSTFGGPPAPPPKPKGFFERGEYEDFSLLRVVLGYGIPTMLAAGLASLSFALRDL